MSDDNSRQRSTAATPRGGARPPWGGPAPAEPAATPMLPRVLLVLLAAAGTFALTMGARQSMGLFLGNMNTATGLGLASISLAFAFGQLWWGLTQPFAGMVADRVGAGACWSPACCSWRSGPR